MALLRTVPLIDRMQVHQQYVDLTPAAIAEHLCSVYLTDGENSYTADGWPDDQLVSQVFHAYPIRQAFDRLADLCGGACIVDRARRVLYCAVERAERQPGS